MLEQDTTHIRRPTPAPIRKVLEDRGIALEDIIVAAVTDLDIAGEYAESWVVATRDHAFVFALDDEFGEPLVLKDVALADVETVRTDTRVGSGFLEIKVNDVFEELARFSNRNAEKFNKIASLLKSLSAGKQVSMGKGDEEVLVGRCQKCGRPVPEKRMKICPKCVKRGLVFMRFLARVRDYWPYASVAMVLVVLTILIQLVPQQLTRVLVDNVFGEQPLPGWLARFVDSLGATSKIGMLYVVVAALAVTTLSGAIVLWLRETLAAWLANRLGYDLRKEVFLKLEDLAVRYHDTHPVGQLMTRCSQDIEALQGFINQLTSGFGYQILLVIGVAAIMLATNWKLMLWAVMPAPFVMVFTALYYRRIIPRWRKYWTSRSSLANILHGSLNGVRVVKAFAQEAREARRFDRYSSNFRDAGMSVNMSTARFTPFISWLFQLGSYFVWLLGGKAIIDAHAASLADDTLRSAAQATTMISQTSPDELTLGTLLAFLGYLTLFYSPLNALTQMSTWFTSFTTQAHRVFEVLDEAPEIEEFDDAVEIEIQGAIQFREVTFGYDPHIPILHDVSFRVNPGEMLGVVGHSGSGKSTTVNLIMRFYDPQEGQITIDNIDIQKIKKLCLRRQVGLVAQDPFLFPGSIAENVAYGNPRVAPERILDAALAANAHMFITRIHDGYDTRLGEHGSGLSGGERQRVAIARALLHNPRILILDEATSSVDTIAEREIQKALEALSLGRTTIAIAHRLSTLRNCDRILVFEEGIIREQGTHEELLEQNGIYKKLVEIQAQLTSDRATSVDNLKATGDIEKADAVKREAPAPVSQEERSSERSRLAVPRIRYLDPKQLHLYSKDEGGMRVVYRDEVYDHVRAYRCFPTSRPSEFIALWTGESALEHKEIGMIRRLKELAPSSSLAIGHELTKRYFIHYITKILSIKEDIGFLTWHVETDKGLMEFMTKNHDRRTVIEMGTNGRIIFDLDNNRYEIENLDTLAPADKATFLKYVYWT